MEITSIFIGKDELTLHLPFEVDTSISQDGSGLGYDLSYDRDVLVSSGSGYTTITVSNLYRAWHVVKKLVGKRITGTLQQHHSSSLQASSFTPISKDIFMHESERTTVEEAIQLHADEK